MILTNTIWTEKYRPNTLENFIGNEPLKVKFQEFIAAQSIPHLLFVGPPGTGKTTAAKILIKHIDCDSKILNASDQNNIETVRTEIRSFAATSGFAPLKIMVLDEFDGFTRQGQEALRNLMEQYSDTTRFILTANYIERISAPIVSRSQTHFIEPMSKRAVAMHVADILRQEGVAFEITDLKVIIDTHFPDIRKIIGEVESKSGADKILRLDTSAVLNVDFKRSVMEILSNASLNSNKKFTSIRQVFADAKTRDFIGVYRTLFEHVEEYAKGDQISTCILHINQGQYLDSLVVDKEINMMATLINIITTISHE